MGAVEKLIDKKVLQTLIPFNALSPTHFTEVAKKTVIDTVRAGRYLFREGERDNESVYVLEGDVNLLSGKEIVGNIVGGSDAAQHPVAHQQPRQVSARARSNCVVARIDSSFLDIFLTWDQSAGYEVQEIEQEQDDDWMTRILQSQVFLKLPPSNIQRLLMRVESISANAGDEVIRQGSEGDYFYIIKSGRCVVSRKASVNAGEVRLAELADGDVFGEEALVSDARRNATVTMTTDGTLMRLAKSDFIQLLKEPLVNRVGYQQALAMVAQGAAWLDVRLPGEFQNSAIPGSCNIPLSALRREADGLAADTKYIVCCDTGRRSESAAFVLSQRGLDVYLLVDGLSSVPAADLTGTLKISQDAETGVTDAEVYDLESKRVARTEESLRRSTDPGEDTRRFAGSDEELRAVREQLEETAARAELLQQKLEASEAAVTETSSARDELQALEERFRQEMDEMRATAREQTMELEQSLLAARKEVNDAQAKAADLAGELQELAQVVKGKDDELVQSQGQIEQLEDSERRLISELEERRGEYEVLQGQLEEGRQQLEVQLAEQISASESARQAYKEQHVQLQRQYDELEKDRDHHRSAVAELEQQIAAAVAEATAAAQTQNQELEAAQKELETARTQLDDVRIEYDQGLSAFRTEAEAREREFQEKIKILEISLQAARQAGQDNSTERAQRLASLEAQLDDRMAELQRTQTDLGKLQTEKDELQAALGKAREEVTELEVRASAQVSTAQQGQAAAEKAAGETRRELEELHRQLEDLQQAREQLEAEGRAVTGQRDQHAREIEQLKDELDLAQKRFDDLEGSLEGHESTLRTQLDEAQARLAASDERIARVESARDAVAEEAEALRRELESSDTQHAAAEQERQQLQAEILRLTGELQNVREMQEEAGQHLAESADQTDRAQRQLADAQSRERDLCEEIAALKAELDRVRSDAERAGSEAREAADKLRLELENAVQARGALEQDIKQSEDRIRQLEAAASATREDEGARQTREAELLGQIESLTARIDGLLAEKGEAEAVIIHLEKDIEITREALAREQRRIDGEKARHQKSLASASHASDAQIEQLHVALDDAEGRAVAAERELGKLRQVLEETKARTVEEHAVLTAELAQLRQATAADIDVTHHEVERLRQELEIAKQASAQDASEGEIERLQFLLDEARDQVLQQQYEAESEISKLRRRLGEAAAGESVPLDEDHEAQLHRLGVELSAVRTRFEDAVRLHDEAQKEIASLRQQLETASARASLAAAAGVAAAVREQDHDMLDLAGTAPRKRRSGPATGIMFGLVLGVAGAAGFLWHDGQQTGRVSAASDAATPTPQIDPIDAPTAQPAQPNPVAPPSFEPAPVPAPTPAQLSPEPAPTPAQPSPKPVEVSKDPDPQVLPAPLVREFRDRLNGDGSGPMMVALPGGEFLMGSSSSSLDFDERPRHKVTVPPFAIGKYEVTFDEYDRFADDTGRARPDDEDWGRGRRPVINVSWHDALAYAEWLSEQTDHNYRLPSEAEWEYMAAAGSRSLYWWGANLGAGQANCFNCGSQWDAKRTAPVGSFPGSAFSVHDTAGNVREWVHDCYIGGYDYAPDDGSPWLESGCAQHVTRGGGFDSAANTLRTTKRGQQAPDSQLDTLGFRLARDL
jgi:formylglycine-generating enzyme required for sulfatase activity/chromosome segregation ATPase/CRP-like cAMP-binding protein